MLRGHYCWLLESPNRKSGTVILKHQPESCEHVLRREEAPGSDGVLYPQKMPSSSGRDRQSFAGLLIVDRDWNGLVFNEPREPVETPVDRNNITTVYCTGRLHTRWVCR